MKARFRGYLPVVVDLETGGFNADTDALLEIAASPVKMSTDGSLYYDDVFSYHIAPFAGANIDPAALEFTGINPYHPLRPSQSEADALKDLYTRIRAAMKEVDCKRAILVAHNATFDQSFMHAANERCAIKRNPFHPFSTFDTAALSGLALGQTVLAKACIAANIEFSNEDAHSAVYDTRKTAELFCFIVNRWRDLGGWPPPQQQSDDCAS
ncbi:MAG: ribonuclease T [Pseudomonadales bacterium]